MYFCYGMDGVPYDRITLRFLNKQIFETKCFKFVKLMSWQITMFIRPIN